MPNRYEREIEEILRNLEHTDSKPGSGQKAGERMRRRARTPVRPRPRMTFSFHFTVTEWLLIITVVAALLAGGYAYYQKEADIFSGAVALIGILALILVALSPFVFRQRNAPTAARYTKVTQLRRSPMDAIKTRWNLFMLKLRYRRRNDLR